MFRGKLHKLFFLLVAAGIFAYASYRPTFRLRADMPKEFVATASSGAASSQRTEEQMAGAYWETVITEIQWKYGYLGHLPQEPPPEFKITTEDLGPVAKDPATRARYWHKLREVWYLPGTWKRNYEWDLGWLRDPVVSFGSRLQDSAGKLVDR